MDDKDVTIRRLTEQVSQLLERVAKLEVENGALREEIARLKKNSSNSSKPPSSDIIKPAKVKPGRKGKRKRGGQVGHAKHERTPFPDDQVDEAFEYELCEEDAQGLTALDDWFVIQQIELTERPFVITEHRARKYMNPHTGGTLLAPLPPEVVNGGLVGPKLSALIAYQKSACHMSYTTIQTFLRDVFGLSLSTGQLAKVVQKASVPARRDWPGRMTNFRSRWRPRRVWGSTRRGTRRTGRTCGPGASGPTISPCFISIRPVARRS